MENFKFDPHPNIQISDLVTISTKTGDISYGNNYTPDAAAQAFWGALGRGATAIAAEREECAKVAEEWAKTYFAVAQTHDVGSMPNSIMGRIASDFQSIAAAIRARGQE